MFTVSWMISSDHNLAGHAQVVIIKRETKVQVFFRNAYDIEL